MRSAAEALFRLGNYTSSIFVGKRIHYCSVCRQSSNKPRSTRCSRMADDVDSDAINSCVLLRIYSSKCQNAIHCKLLRNKEKRKKRPDLIATIRQDCQERSSWWKKANYMFARSVIVYPVYQATSSHPREWATCFPTSLVCNCSLVGGSNAKGQ